MIPRARKTERAKGREAGDAIVIRLAAPPVDGAANDALVEFLAARLSVPRRAVTIVSGERSRQKRLSVTGTTTEVVRARLEG